MSRPSPALSLILPSLASLCVPLAAHAQDDEIVVTGTGLPAPPGEAAYATTMIGSARLATVASGRIEDALRDVAGVAQFRRSDSSSAHPTSQGITLRGFSGNAASRTLLLLDGVPQTDPFGGWVPFPAYLPERLAGVRVTRGAGSGYQGPGALAGTVELFSGTPRELGPLQLRADYGSYNSVDASAIGAARLGDGFVTVAAQYGRSDGFVPTAPEDRGPVDQPAPYEQASFAVRAVAPVRGDTELQANISAFTDSRNRGTAYTDVHSKGADASLRLVGHGDWGWSALAYLQDRQFASGFASINATRTTVTPSLNQYDVPAIGMGGRIEVQPPVGGGVTLRLGSDLRRVSGRTEEFYTYSAGAFTRRRVAGGASLTAGTFADASLEQGPLTLNAGLRADHWSIQDGSLLSGIGTVNNVRYANRDGWEGTGRLGAAYAVTPAVTLRAAGYRGWRLPTLNELYRPYRVGADSTAANPALSPERLTGAEAGVRLAPLPGLTADATFFWNRLDHAVANVTLSVSPTGARSMLRENVDAIEAQGGEFDLHWSRGPLNLSASYAYTDAHVHASGAAAALNGKRPAETAMHQTSATLGWHRADWGGSVTVRYTGPQFDDDQNVDVLHAAFTVDGELSVPLSHGFAVQGRVQNLFDERVEAGISGNDIVERALPRTLWIGFRYRMR